MIPYLFLIEYDGSNFSGWQKQPGERTVQAEFEKALERLYHVLVSVEGAGRTDKGVHALAQAVSAVLPDSVPVRRMLIALNTFLPPDIVVHAIRKKPTAFNARYAARKKTYRYIIWNSPARPVLSKGYAWHVPGILNCTRMRSAARFLMGTHDFSAFSAGGGKQKNKQATIDTIRISRSGKKISLEFTADRFLYKMVRTMVGTLCLAGSGKIPPARIPKILASRERSLAGQTAPPDGLFLAKVFW